MRIWSVIRKCAREQKRDLWVLGLSLVFAPLFVFIYWLFTGGNATTSYAALVINHDEAARFSDGVMHNAGEDVILAMQELTFKDGSPILRVSSISDRDLGETALRDRDATLLVIIPPSFSQTLANAQSGAAEPTTQVEFIGDLTNPYYTVAAVMAMTALDGYAVDATGEYRAVSLLETALGDSAARTEFEMYIPGLLVLAVIMMLFQAAMLVARDIESGSLQRLKITRLTAFEYLSGTTAWLALIAIAEVLLTFAVAVAFGFRSHGALWVAILVGVITSLSIIGVGMIVASLSKTVSQAFVIANFPFGFFMFLSGAAFPIPMNRLFTIAERDIKIIDVLPPTHAVAALNKVFTLEVGLSGVLYELTALSVLSVIYFSVGVWLFRKRHLN
ncbi:MAG: ABC transporter permease [Chloroflexi bacterium]|nr:MAG: ABC transporter permease [Chloroflexota bacterium]MBL1192739.1 ABC transporter permease [Chloroflexota bacterium]NOH10031.1 ABC transporter permease [Chloroflexota bacterium]